MPTGSTIGRIPLLILGSGLAGLGAGVEAQRQGIQSLILEADELPGGLCRSSKLLGCEFDFGPKILILDESENSADILNFLDGNQEGYPLRENVYLTEHGLLDFPLQRNLVDLPLAERMKILRDIEWAQHHPRPIRSYRDWLVNGYGQRLCEQVLFPYEEKKWQISLDDLDYTWALDRPVKVHLDEVKAGAFTKLQPSRQYFYPKVGSIATLSEAMAEQAGEIVLETRVEHIDLERKLVHAGHKTYSYDTLISSIPLDDEVRMTGGGVNKVLRQQVSSTLRRLSIRVFNLIFEGNVELDGTAIYFPEKEFLFRRICVLQNLCPSLSRTGKTPLSIEISLKPEEAPPAVGDQLSASLEQLKRIPQFAKLGRLLGHEVREIDFAYPMQTNGLRALVDRVHQEYARHGVFHCGRGGNFDYCNSDIAYRQGRSTVQQLSRGTLATTSWTSQRTTG
ncbi:MULTISPECIES: NAD(P)-binding protein [Amycolatopsis]|uniref:Protoporphyrinogen oxidase n=2 Tax=Amycolatopsis TaxID=1813 RepID=A0A1I3PBZ4_9PSEU|nr:NAD(P)-binding protein [Amycolatopsis sacchari]SFJ18941.1 Protoporphyrinogen oxidase [Amycolatopsis sacchari]